MSRLFYQALCMSLNLIRQYDIEYYNFKTGSKYFRF